MSKQEFLENLRYSLNGELNISVVEEHIHYYDSYIQNQIRLGNSESDVLNQLGDPRLIAKSILGANAEASNMAQNAYDEQEARQEKSVKVLKLKSWGIIILIILIIILLISLFFSIVWALLPVIIPVIGVVFLVRILSKY